MKFHKKYAPLLDPKVRKSLGIRYVILTGGRGSGKSTAGSHFLHDVSFNADNVAIHSRFTMTSAKISVAAELIQTINDRNSYNFFHVKELQVTNKVSRGLVIFKGLKTGSLNQTAALKSVTNLNIWYLDEAEELHDESVFDDVDESIRRKGYENLIILSLNTYRISKDHFIYQRFFKERNIPDFYNGVVDDTLYIHTTYLDNLINLDKSFLNIVEKAKKAYTIKEKRELLESEDQEKNIKYILKDDGLIYDVKKNEPIYSEKFQFRYLGKFRKRAEGAVFENWGIYKEEPENYDAVYFGGDFGFTNDPTATVEVKVDKVNKAVYIKQHLYQTGLLNSQIAKAMKPIIGEHAIIFDSAEAKSISELRFEHELSVSGAIKGPDSIRVGVNKMKEWLILVHEESGDLIHEFNNYRYVDKEGLTNEFVDEDNHCFRADTMISTIEGQKRIDCITTKDKVLTRFGYKGVLWSGIVKKELINKYTFHIDANRYIVIFATDNHLIKTKYSWKQISKIRKGDVIYLNKNLTGKSTSFIKEKDTTPLEESTCIGKFGNTLMMKYREVIIYIIKMVILTITKLKTLNLFLQLIMQKYIKKQEQMNLNNREKIILMQLDLLLKNGIGLRRGKNGIESMLNNLTLVSKHMEKENAKYAIKNLQHYLKRRNSVQINVSQKIDYLKDLITSQQFANIVEKNIQKINIQKSDFVQEVVVQKVTKSRDKVENTYDITVADVPEYFANGILVHNCIDATRYVFLYYRL